MSVALAVDSPPISEGYVYITCNDAEVDFIHARKLQNVGYEGRFSSIFAVQVTKLADGIFISCAVNHAITYGTSFWNFFNTFAEVSRGVNRISMTSNYCRDSVLISPAVLKLPAGDPKVSFSGDAPLREIIFSFSRESI
ncbi:HXXXD-type acyl-transferase family protein [Forsythia ovata]|uniref:HXXXD-type acyl-transferase family protein n=1 Tax=Forsythia ovata TaxID=205694 RepID=A0ABD1SMX6_9LAMI